MTGSNNFGYWVCGAGDLDGDGHAEVLVGAPGKDGKVMGYAELFHGNDLTSWVKWDGTDPNESNFGITVYGPGDLNLDGVPDLVICSWRSDLRGRVRVYSGDFIVNQTGKEILWQQDGVADDKMFICSGRGGDVNNDSYPDLAVGGYGANSGAGFVRVFSGLDGTLITELTEPGGAPGNFFGSSVALANVNGDSHADIIVGAYESLGRGLVWVFSGQSPYPVLSQFPGKPDEGFGARVEALETATPGVVWLLVGAPRAAGTRGMVCVVL